MALLDDIKASLRITSAKLDAEVQMLIGAALYDMERAGVNPELLALDDDTEDLQNAFVKHAVTAYCKAEFGYDVDEAARFKDSYYRIVCDLLNSSQNVAAMDEADEAGSDGSEDDEADGEGGE